MIVCVSISSSDLVFFLFGLFNFVLFFFGSSSGYVQMTLKPFEWPLSVLLLNDIRWLLRFYHTGINNTPPYLDRNSAPVSLTTVFAFCTPPVEKVL